MIELKTKIDNKRETNLVFFVEKEADLKFLRWQKINKKIVDNLKEKISIGENKTYNYFLWQDNIEQVFIIYFNKENKKDINYFLWAEFPKLPKNLTIFTNNDKNIETLLNNCILSRYKFQEYKSEKEEDEIVFIVNPENQKIYEERINTIKNIVKARDLWFMPSNDLFPESFADLVNSSRFKNIKVKVLDYKKIQKLGLWLIDAVWKWSEKKPRVVILEKIIDKNLPTIWLVWKWITFDTWWIQVKPGDFMYEMKGDMCWAATVFSTMKELDEKKLNVNIVACLVLAENHISWNAYKPSDIIKSYSWKTVDIIHTDAEWRLVLADWVSYLSKNYKLDKIITVATLTWACMVALWYRYAGIMWNDENLISQFLDYSKNNFEKYNRLPFDDYFIEKTKSKIADLENLNRWVYAWSTMWAAFLSNFLLNWEKYTHLDIAWTALNSLEPYGYANLWMTWFWVDSISYILKNLK